MPAAHREEAGANEVQKATQVFISSFVRIIQNPLAPKPPRKQKTINATMLATPMTSYGGPAGCINSAAFEARRTAAHA